MLVTPDVPRPDVPGSPVARTAAPPQPGKVWLIGAGPGDPELLTLKAVRALGLADVVLVDALVNRAAGIEHEVVSGITAGIGVPAALGIPVTHRALTCGVTLVTGHTRDGQGPDWQALAAGGTTLVIYMGVSQLDAITERLRSAGLPAHMPAAAIQSGTLEAQRQVVATLATLAREVAAAGRGSPAIVVVGEVVGLAQQSNVGDASVRRAA